MKLSTGRVTTALALFFQRRVLIAVMVIAAAVYAYNAAGSFSSQAGDGLKWRVEPVTVITEKGNFVFATEIADTSPLRQRGLMFREHMAENAAMLFDFQSTGAISMWMKNTPLSLDMVFIREDGIVHRIEHDTVPYSEAIIRSGAAIRAVLEVRAGVARKIGLAPGDRISHRMFSTR